MSTDWRDPPGELPDIDAPLRTLSCSRIGLQANPPRARLPLGGWLSRR